MQTTNPLIVYVNELRLFWAKSFYLLLHPSRVSDIEAVGTIFNIFGYDVVWVRFEPNVVWLLYSCGVIEEKKQLLVINFVVIKKTLHIQFLKWFSQSKRKFLGGDYDYFCKILGLDNSLWVKQWVTFSNASKL